MSKETELPYNPQVRTDEPMDLVLELRERRYPGGIMQIVKLQDAYNDALARSKRRNIVNFPKQEVRVSQKPNTTFRPLNDADLL